MEDLIDLLQHRGFEVQLKANKVSVKLEGLSNQVSIHKDIVTNRYKVKTNDTALSIGACVFLFTGLNSMSHSGVGGLLSFALIAVSMFSFMSVVLTELKLNSLRSVIDELNSQSHA